MYVYTMYTCVHTHTAVDLCVRTAVCITLSYQRLAAGLLYLWLILIVYYKNLQKFCKQRGSTDKFDLYINKLV